MEVITIKLLRIYLSMSFFGMNPKFKEFAEKYPEKTMLGMAWALYWRFGVLILALELLVFGGIFLLAALANS